MALYITMHGDVRQAFDFFRKNEKALQKKKKTFHLFFEKNQDKFYTHNLLRNCALNYTDTEYIINLDMDLMLPKNAYFALKSHNSK